MKKLLVTTLSLLVLLSTQSYARQIPKGLATDSRIKVIEYDPDNVVEVNTTFGYATTIVLAKGEYITLDGGIGKKAGWDIVSKPKTRFIVVKPKLANSTTNLNFSTNKGRIYSFMFRPTSNTHRTTYQVRFTYPDFRFGSPFASRASTYNVISNFGNPLELNNDYSFVGDTTIAPIQAQDNGTFTLLKFPKGTPVPAILAVDLKTKRESLVNFRMQGEFVVVEGVYPQYTLRYGAHVTCLFNDKAIGSWYYNQKPPRFIPRRAVYAKAQPKPVKASRRTK